MSKADKACRKDDWLVRWSEGFLPCLGLVLGSRVLEYNISLLETSSPTSFQSKLRLETVSVLPGSIDLCCSGEVVTQ
jgi:hypothetical protein